MQVVVKDSNFIIDLFNGQLLASWQLLRVQAHTTDFVIYEVEREGQLEVLKPFIASILGAGAWLPKRECRLRFSLWAEKKSEE